MSFLATMNLWEKERTDSPVWKCYILYIINNLVNPCAWWPCGIRTTVLFVGGCLLGNSFRWPAPGNPPPPNTPMLQFNIYRSFQTSSTGILNVLVNGNCCEQRTIIRHEQCRIINTNSKAPGAIFFDNAHHCRADDFLAAILVH